MNTHDFEMEDLGNFGSASLDGDGFSEPPAVDDAPPEGGEGGPPHYDLAADDYGGGRAEGEGVHDSSPTAQEEQELQELEAWEREQEKRRNERRARLGLSTIFVSD